LGSPIITRTGAARPLPRVAETSPVLHFGTTLSSAPGIVVATEEGPATATRAASCLVAPEPGDSVLLCTAGADTFVLAVLVRAQPSALTIAPSDCGELVVGADVVRLAAGRELQAAAPSIAVHTRTVSIVADVATLLGRLMTVAGQRLRTTVGTQEIAAVTQSSKVGTRVSIVDGADILEAADVSQRVTGTLTSHAGVAVMTAATDIRLDAQRVSVG
jgi:hypothetical protein